MKSSASSRTSQQVLVLNASGMPTTWMSPREVVRRYYAKDKVAWELGDVLHSVLLHGGLNDLTGMPSVIRVSSILAVAKSERGLKHMAISPRLPSRSNAMLFARDRYLCAYCGETFVPSKLTRDHVIPRHLGGQDTWTNCVSACWECNQRKGGKLPKDFKPLLYVPYTPNFAEKLILEGRNILADQMDYLMANVPKESRLQPH